MLLFLPTEPVLEIFFLYGDGLHGVVGIKNAEDSFRENVSAVAGM